MIRQIEFCWKKRKHRGMIIYTMQVYPQILCVQEWFVASVLDCPEQLKMVEIPPQQICLPWYLCPRISICLPWYPCPRISFCMVNKLWFTVHLLSDTEAKVSNADLSQKSLYFLSCLSSFLCFTRMILFTYKKPWLQLNYDSKELITSMCLNWEKSVWCFYGFVVVIIIIIMVFPFSFHRPNTLCPNALSCAFAYVKSWSIQVFYAH
jgi:hypothetical protein